jgi:hypothetical protein
MEKKLREFEPDSKNTRIDAPSKAIKIESKEKTFQESTNEAKAEESIKYPPVELFAIIIFIISIIYIAMFGGINSNNTDYNNNTLDTSNQTIPVTIPFNDPGSPIAGTWKFENMQGIVSTIIFDKDDNAIIDGKPYKYSIFSNNLILKDNKSSSAIPYKLVDENNLLLKLRGSNYDNYVTSQVRNLTIEGEH